MLRTLAHHWRIHLAVAIGAAVACAVLSGALLVGDSVRGSLRDLTLDRLGAIDHALVSHRFFRATLADDLGGQPGFSERFAKPVSLIALRGAATHADSGARASRVGIHGIDPAFAELFDTDLPLERTPGQVFPSVVLNGSLQRELGAGVGDSVLLSFGLWSDIPRETLMGETDPEDVLGSIRATVAAVVPDRGVGRFGLVPSQQTPLNAFLALDQLQRALDRRDETNAIVLSERGPEADPAEALRGALAPRDLGLAVERHEDHLTITSREFVLRPAVDAAIGEVAAELGTPLVRTQSYLANEMRLGERSVPYSMVVALDPRNGLTWATLPLADGTRATALADDGILLNEWTARQLDAAVGDSVEMTYYAVGMREELIERTASFRVEGIVRMEGLGADRSLVPDYPGIRDAEDISAWDPPFPVDLDRIRTEDELYWDRHGPTPKAFVSEATGRKLWATRFGSTTAARLGAPAGSTLEDAEPRARAALMARLTPESFGLAFRPVRAEGLRAASGATDFSQLFLGFSFFLILSAALLIGLLFRLGVEQRSGEIGLMLAVGHRVRSVRRRLLAEGALLAAAGGLVGLGGAVGFAGLMMAGLRTVWKGAVGSSELYLHVTPLSLAIGWTSTVMVVLLSVFLAVRKLVRLAPPRLLAGAVSSPGGRSAALTSRLLAWGGLIGAAALAGVAIVSGAVQSPGLAFGSGALLLTGGVAAFARWCRGSRRRPVTRPLVGLAARNTSWNPGRSILAVALVASACFMIVVVEVFRIDPDEGLDARDSGSGGFSLVAESDVPLHQNLDRQDELFAVGFSKEDAASVTPATIFQARVLPGDDASCQNLYRPERPTIVGLPSELIARGGFRFSRVLDSTNASDPWRLLEHPAENGVVPAVADAASAQWILHMKLGDELVLDDETGRPMRLRLVAFLDRSLFRSELLIAERHFTEHFPSNTGDSYFLIEAPATESKEIARILEAGLDDFGFDVVSVGDKMAGYDAVQNTYLSTFQVLGGLGLLLGTAGLGVVLVRNVIERRGELATLRAFGFRRSRLAAIVLAENAFLLLVGVGVGVLAAAIAVGPGIAGRSLPWPSLAGTLAAVFAVGMLSSVAAVIGTLRIPLLPALKAER